LFFDDDGRVYVQGAYAPAFNPNFTIRQFEIDINTGRSLSEQKDLWKGFAKGLDGNPPYLQE
jgi:hypothetical protein